MINTVDIQTDRFKLAEHFKEVNKTIPEEVKVYLRALHASHGNATDDCTHAHFHDTSTLNIDGTWANDKGFKLNKCVRTFLLQYGFNIPQDNKTRPKYLSPADKPIAYSEDEILLMSKGIKMPVTMRKMDRAHNGALFDHIHFVCDDNKHEPVLNNNGTWDRPLLGRELSEEEKAFLDAINWAY